MKYAGIKLIDRIRKTQILQKYQELHRLADQPEQMAELRRTNLIGLITYLKSKNSYYQPLLKTFSNDEISDNPIAILKTLPITDKQLINLNYKRIYNPDPHRPSQKKKTGGSTGTPFYYHVDKEHLSWFWAHIYYFWNRYGGFNPGDPFVTIAGNSLRTTNRQVSESVYHFLQNNYFIKGDVIDRNMKVSAKHIQKAVILYGYPSSILNIIRIKPDIPGLFKNLKAIFTTSEQLTPQYRKGIENAFGKPVFDMYGANDGGILSCECTEHEGYHINMLNCLVENFENEHGMDEILLTNLSSYSFPFVRYKVGDLGTISDKPCKCGLSWPKITDLKGRTRDLIKLPLGSVIHGSYFNNIFYRYPNIDGYKIVQHKDYSLEVLIHIANDEDFIKTSSEISIFITKTWPELKVRVNRLTKPNPTDAKFKIIESHVV
jgi:phenylacetate-CoA ligase